jgi:hypothetical protein
MAQLLAGLSGGAPLPPGAQATSRLAGRGFSGLQIQDLKRGSLAGTEADGDGGFINGLAALGPGISDIFGTSNANALATMSQGFETRDYGRALAGAVMFRGNAPPLLPAPLDDSDLERRRASTSSPQRTNGKPLRMYLSRY